MQAVLLHKLSDEIARIFQSLLAAYFHIIPANELFDSSDHAKRQEQLVYIALIGAACSLCISRNGTFERFRTHAALFEDRLAIAHLLSSQLLAIPISSQLFVSVSSEARGKLNRSVVKILQQAMCIHDAEKIILAARDIKDINGA